MNEFVCCPICKSNGWCRWHSGNFMDKLIYFSHKCNLCDNFYVTTEQEKVYYKNIYVQFLRFDENIKYSIIEYQFVLDDFFIEILIPDNKTHISLKKKKITINSAIKIDWSKSIEEIYNKIKLYVVMS